MKEIKKMKIKIEIKNGKGGKNGEKSAVKNDNMKIEICNYS